jgi:hypothetical protein
MAELLQQALALPATDIVPRVIVLENMQILIRHQFWR